MSEIVPQPDKQDLILIAAFAAFSTYGYRRTSMDDIAKGAGISRSALYLHWRNKEDVFRSLAARYFEEVLRDMALALADASQGAEAALMAAFVAKDGKFMEAVLTTPHGSELLDAGFAISGDVVAMAEGRLVAVLADWLARRGLPDGIGKPAEVAETILTALVGLKKTAKTLESYRLGEARLARLFARALGEMPR